MLWLKNVGCMKGSREGHELRHMYSRQVHSDKLEEAMRNINGNVFWNDGRDEE